jgi:hypothetical protein
MLQAEYTANESGQGEAALRRHLQRMRALEQLIGDRGTPLHKAAAAYYRLTAEEMLENGNVTIGDEL